MPAKNLFKYWRKFTSSTAVSQFAWGYRGWQEKETARGSEKERGKAFRNWLGKRISLSTRLDSPRPASPRTLKSSQKLNFKPIVASPEPAPAPAPTVGLWPHLGMCIASSPVELRHLHHMPNREQERAKAALWLKCSECCSFLWHGQLAEGLGGSRGCHKGGLSGVTVSQLCLSDFFCRTADGLCWVSVWAWRRHQYTKWASERSLNSSLIITWAACKNLAAYRHKGRWHMRFKN